MLSTKLVSLSALFPGLPHVSNPSISVHYHKFAVVDDTSVFFILPLPSSLYSQPSPYAKH